ncbi:MAG: 50S ribosomal protein L10 [Anaerolineae bacterium]|jgi:large subunit ribosomal protein L10|nr:50S ribosomal protein L10 [Anaerolineae bacterium]
MVAEYVRLFSNSQALVVVDYRGLPMKVINKLRADIRPAGSKFMVVKNTLARIALQQAGLAVPQDLLKGTTAITVCGPDVAATVKALKAVAQDTKVLQIKGAILGRSVLDAAGAEALADLPPREVLLAQVVGAIQAPLSGLVTVLSAPMRGLVTVLKAYADKKAA